MQLKAPSFDQLCWIVILLGIGLRVWIWLLNPPDHTYDGHHHQHVISIYAEEKTRPAPDRCWQCYHPPFFYSLSAFVLQVSQFALDDAEAQWKATQGINTVASCLTLVLLFYLLRLLWVRPPIRLIILSLAVVLPRDLLSSAMMSNDYLLVFFTTVSAYLFVRIAKQVNQSGVMPLKPFALLSGAVILGALTKQHGLLLLFFPLYISYNQIKNSSPAQAFRWVGILVLITGMAGSSELWLYSQTGQWLISNQAFFDFATSQKPGSLSEVEFATLRLSALFHDPLLHDATKSSVPTQLFARLWFDHEYWFVNRETPFVAVAGRVAYGFGLAWTISALLITGYYGFRQVQKQRLKLFNLKSSTIVPLILISLLFLLVPVVQTIRLPYFSSMKALFYLPGLPVMLALLGFCCQQVFTRIDKRLIIPIVLLNILFGIGFLIPISYHLG